MTSMPEEEQRAYPWPKAWVWAVGVGLAVLLLAYLRLHATSPIGIRLDSWSESNAIVSARNAARNGWLAYGGVAQHQVDRPPFRSDPLYYYAHYPLAASYLAWAAWPVTGENIAMLRWLPALSSVIAVLLWFALVSRIAGARAAMLSTAVLASTYGFVAYADDLHHSYTQALLIAMLLAVREGVASTGRRRVLWLSMAWAASFVCSFFSWEWYLWAQVFVWGYALLIAAPPRRWLVLFLLAPVLAFGMQKVVRDRAFGDVASSVGDDLLRRTIQLEDTADTPPGVTLTSLPEHVATRVEQFYGTSIAALVWLGLGVSALSGRIRLVDGWAALPVRWLAILFASGVSWWVVMWQHTAVHQHVMRHIVLFYALVLGLALDFFVSVIVGGAHRRWARLLAAVALVLTLVPHASRFGWDIAQHGDRGFKHPFQWSGGWDEVAEMEQLAAKVPRDAIVLTNNNRLPLLRYWLDVPVYPATFERFPYRRKEPPPDARLRLELTASHLSALYPDAPTRPRIVYLYAFRGEASSRYVADPLLWWLVDGVWAKPTGYDRLIRFQQILAGKAEATHRVIARGDRWLCFEADGLIDDMPAGFAKQSDPSRAQFGPPR